MFYMYYKIIENMFYSNLTKLDLYLQGFTIYCTHAYLPNNVCTYAIRIPFCLMLGR